jgi:hypothetical protein
MGLLFLSSYVHPVSEEIDGSVFEVPNSIDGAG